MLFGNIEQLFRSSGAAHSSESSKEQWLCDDSTVEKVLNKLAADDWYKKTLESSAIRLDQLQMEQLVRESYEVLAPVLCEFVLSVQSSFSGFTKICPFRSGEIYWQIAQDLLPRSERNEWFCFDYPRDLKYRAQKTNLPEFDWWFKSRDVKDHVLNPTRLVLVDLGFEGSVFEIFNAARSKNNLLGGVKKQTKASFIFSTQRGKEKLGDCLDYQILLPNDHHKMTEDELFNDPVTLGEINLAQVIHDSTRGCFAPIQLVPNLQDTIISEGQISRPLHPNPWIYARNYLVRESILEYARNNRRRLKKVQKISDLSTNRAVNWAACMSEADLRLFTLSDWELEVIYAPNSSST